MYAGGGMSRINKERLEKIMEETTNWLLRPNEEIEPSNIYITATRKSFGENLSNDSYVRVVRNVLRYIMEKTNE